MFLNRKIFTLITLRIFISTSIIHAQEEEFIMEEHINNESESTEVSENLQLEEFLIELDYLSKNPISLNTAKRSEIENIPYLNDFQINRLLDYLDNFRPIVSIYELTYIHGFNRDVIEKIRRYITIDYAAEKKSKNQHFLYQKIIHSNKWENRHPFQLYNRYFFENQKNKMGITMENDPGEDFFGGNNKTGFDFYSFFYERKPNVKHIEKIIFGDFKVNFGQGLNLWTGYSGNYIGATTSIRKKKQGIFPYTSSNESNYFKGIATEFSFGDMSMSLFYSLRKLDATLHENDTMHYFTSINHSGIHVSPSQIENQKSILSRTTGCNITFQKKYLKSGITMYQNTFSTPFFPNNSLNKKFLQHGNDFLFISSDVSIFLRKTTLFGEVVGENNTAFAFVGGLTQQLPMSHNMTILYRNYPRNYLSFYGNAYGKQSLNTNEKGLLITLKSSPYQQLSYIMYADVFTFPWFQSNQIGPNNGYSRAIQLTHQIQNKLITYVKFKNESGLKSTHQGENNQLIQNHEYKKNSIKINLSYILSKNLKFMNRIETNTIQINGNKSNGFLCYQHIQYNKKQFTFYARYSIFDTETFENRIYQYENDLKYSFSIPFLYGKGSKSFLLVKWKSKRAAEIYMKLENLITDKKEREFKIKLGIFSRI